MAFKKYLTEDNVHAQLDGNVNTTQTQIVFKNGSNVPTAGNWIATLVQYGQDGFPSKWEKVLVTSVAGQVLAVQRAYDGSTAQTFNDSDYVFLNVVSEIIKDIQEQAENPVKWEIKNQTGSTIAQMRVVMATGALGASGKLTGAPFLANGATASTYALGITRTSIADGGDGEALAFGKIHGVDTTGAAFSETWAEGDVLYCSPTVAGGLTKVKPTAPHLTIPIAMIINVHANNGTIAVRVPDTYKIGELNDVLFGTLATGDGIFRHASGYWYNAQAYTKAQTDAAIAASISALIASAPGALDTLDELAAALGDDANFAATVTTGLSNRYTKTESDGKYATLEGGNIFSGQQEVNGNILASGGHITARNAKFFSGDLNNLIETGPHTANNPTNKPSGSTTWGYVEVMRWSTSSGYVLQRWTDMEGAIPGIWVRTLRNSVWDAWVQISGPWLDFTPTSSVIQSTAWARYKRESKKVFINIKMTVNVTSGFEFSFTGLPATPATNHTVLQVRIRQSFGSTIYGASAEPSGTSSMYVSVHYPLTSFPSGNWDVYITGFYEIA